MQHDRALSPSDPPLDAQLNDPSPTTTTTTGDEGRGTGLAPPVPVVGAAEGASKGEEGQLVEQEKLQGGEEAKEERTTTLAGQQSPLPTAQGEHGAAQIESAAAQDPTEPAHEAAQGDAAPDARGSAGAKDPVRPLVEAMQPSAASAQTTDKVEDSAIASELALEQPKPNNAAHLSLVESALLVPSASSTGSVASVASAPAAEGSEEKDKPAAPTPEPTNGTSTPPPPSASPLASSAPIGAPASPSGVEKKPTAAPPLQKKFQSSLAVNKKFLEKAGEKAKPEVKPVATRLATPPIPTPSSTSHPRLFAGKLSSSASSSSSSTGANGHHHPGGPSVSLSTSSAGGAGGAPAPAGWKKPVSPAPGSSSLASSGVSAPTPAGGAGGAVWGAPSRAAGPSLGGYEGGRMGGGMGGGGWGRSGGVRDMASDFPTAAEAAHAKEARARAIAEQMQARERAMAERAAAAAAHNAHLLEELDAFRGVHLDPNAAHWDEDEDDFLDTTIEFADGTQYKIVEDPSAPASAAGADDDELREPGPSELALREKPLAPGEIVEPPKREERFGDDFDRSWPPRQPVSRPDGHPDARNLFNDRLGKFEPAAAAGPSVGGAGLRRSTSGLEPTSILSSRPAAPHQHHERRTSAHGGDVPPHMAPPSSSSARRPSITSPPRRRPSMTSPPTRNIPLPGAPGGAGAGAGRRESFGEHKPAGAWGRRPSDGRLAPPHFAGAAGGAAGGGAGARPLPPHLQQRAEQHPHPLPPASLQQALSPPAAHPATLSPPSQRAPLPSVQSPPTAPSAVLSPLSPSAAPAAQLSPVVDLEETHKREMHTAAERARKRREEEEQARKDQAERARKKAEDMAESMRKVEEEARREREEKEAEVRRAREEKEKEARKVEEAKKAAAAPAPAAPTPATVPATGSGAAAGSWRAAAKPLPPQAAVAPGGSQAVPAPAKILAREAAAAAPPPAAASSAQPAAPAWRRPLPPSQPSAPTSTREPQHGVPPHLAKTQAAQPVAPPAPAAPLQPAAPVEKAPSPAAPLAPTASDAAQPTSPPPTSPPAAPSSPSQDRKLAALQAKLGYKLPAVSQLDDLMSRIKGAMATPNERPSAPAESTAETAAVKLPPPQVALPKPEVSLPKPVAVSPAAPSVPPAPTPPNPAPTVSLPIPTEPRGRGRGRNATPRAARGAAPPVVPSFDSREPSLPPPSSRLPRAASPPPAWRQYTVRLAPYPARRPPSSRNLKNFHNGHFPRPVNSLAFDPPIPQVNTNRLTRDDWLLPKRYIKGVVQYPVAIPRSGGKLVRKRQADKPERAAPSVSISKKALQRSTAPPPAPVVEEKPAEVDETFGPSLSKPADQILGSWRTEGGFTGAVPTASLGDVQLAAEHAEAVLATELAPGSSASGSQPSSTRPAHKKLPEGSSIGFYRPPGASPLHELNSLPLDRSESAKMFMVTSELNGEKVEMTPRRKETTAPGAHLTASGGKVPTSPVFAPQDSSAVLSSPSSASAWPTKSLVLNPIVPSVWSAAPDENAVHARTLSGVKPENSLQGIADDDPSEALPNSLAELKSEDGISTTTEDKEKRLTPKDEAKLRAAAPSFSSFLHEKAGSIDSTVGGAAAQAGGAIPSSRPPSLAFPGFTPQHPPQSTPSPINAYSPAQAYSPQLHPSLQQYARPVSSQQVYSPYPLTSQGVSPFAPQQPHHQAFSPQPFAPQSPAVQAIGYPSSPYRDPTQAAAPPQHITNPALLASYGYGQPVSAASPSRGYGAVGASGPGPIGRPPSESYGRPPLQHGPPPTSYISAGGYQGSPHPVSRVGAESPYAPFGGVGSPQAQHRSLQGPPPPPPSGGFGSSTMLSPVIMPSQPPAVPLFSSASPAHHQQHQHQHSHSQSFFPQQQPGLGQRQYSAGGGGYGQHQSPLPSAVQLAAGIPPYAGSPMSSGGGYGAPGGYGRGVGAGGRPLSGHGAGGMPGRGW
ncbi:hypothetical protein JCM8097_002150 [Rhodosporidiobolus ruineniae]